MRGNPKQVVAINKNGKFSAFTQYKFSYSEINFMIRFKCILVQSVSLFKSELCDTFPHLPLESAPEVH